MTATGGRRRGAPLALALALALALPAMACRAGSVPHCDARPKKLTPADEDRLLRMAGIVRRELDRSGASLALVSRSGIDLQRFGQRHSHAGVSLAAGLRTPWAVRQLYYDCDESTPRLFDQGLAAFVLGMDEPAVGYVSMVLLPGGPAADVERVVSANDRALALLGARYSANAYPFSTRYQNCNQWVAELLALAWQPPSPSPTSDAATADRDAGVPAAGTRERAQAWLRENGYEPTVFEVGWPLAWAAAFVPWVHGDDHPDDDRRRRRYRVSMPASIEAFVRATVPGSRRVEVCHAQGRLVVHRGWDPVAEGCRPGDGDEVVEMDDGGSDPQTR